MFILETEKLSDDSEVYSVALDIDGAGKWLVLTCPDKLTANRLAEFLNSKKIYAYVEERST